ncbi:hypothetical protein BXZ70DRAFT_955894 [Cristinia sonorae]|uniref:Fungal-type protein kinase domain-containing protein n=1 Tax=Cristinia sonorae TaxID=1940300 RepID=A0A8K0UFX8_9AGAR|nr:hypothetical protein BXZ70DRAFT_955894 [Cristinia sonorae]
MSSEYGSDSEHTSATCADTDTGWVAQEIYNQTWQFPPSVVARMLSPKTLPRPRPPRPPTLDDYICELDGHLPHVDDVCARTSLSVVQWPEVNDQRASCSSLATFLSVCSGACLATIKNSPGKSAGKRSVADSLPLFYDHLSFIVYDRAMADDIDRSSLSPSVAGGSGFDHLGVDNTAKLWWSPPETQRHVQMGIPVAVAGSDREMVEKSATYARALFSASPSRSFALVLAFNMQTVELRFLVFHRGGLTASTACNVRTDDGKRGVLQMLLAVLLWREPRDCGFTTFCNEQAYALPRSTGDVQGAAAAIECVLHHAAHVRSRATRVCRVTSPSSSGSASGACDSPGNPREIEQTEQEEGKEERTYELFPRCASYRGDVRHDAAVSSETRWNVHSDERLAAGASVVCKTSWHEEDRAWNEARMLQATSDCFGTALHVCSFPVCHGENEPVSNRMFLPSRDESLKECFWGVFSREAPSKVDRRLFIATLTAVEGDSLMSAQSSLELCDAIVDATLGWLGTFLRGYLQRDISTGNVLRVPTPREMPRFELPRMDDEASLEAKLARLSLTDKMESSEAYAKKIMDAVEALKVTTKGKGFMTDGDLCANMSTYFTQTHSSQAISGTAEFMSFCALDAIRFKRDYLQTPVDDLASLYWVGQWSVLFNEHCQGDSEEEESMRSDAISYRAKVPQDIQSLNDRQTQLLSTSTVCQDWVPILSDWYQSVAKLESIWARTYDSLVMSRNGRNEDILRPLFNRFALRGVAEMLEVMTSHRPRLESSQLFNLPS